VRILVSKEHVSHLLVQWDEVVCGGCSEKKSSRRLRAECIIFIFLGEACSGVRGSPFGAHEGVGFL